MKNIGILIAEDELIVAEDTSDIIKEFGYDVLGIVASGEEIIQKSRELFPDLVLMDIKLKGSINGIMAAEQIQTELKIPIIFVSAFSNERTLNLAKFTEPYGFIIKPFRESELHAAIEISLYKSKIDKKLFENEQFLCTTLDCIGDSVLTADNKNQIKYMNPAAEQLTGWKFQEALGCNLTEVFRIKELNTGPVLIQKKNRELYINYTRNPIRDAKGHTTGVVFTFRDITFQKILEEESRDLNLKLEKRIWKRTEELNLQIDILNQTKKILSESEEKFRVLAEQSYMGILIIQDNRIRYINQSCLDIIELPLVEMMDSRADKLFDFFSRKDRNAMTVLVEKIIQEGIQSEKIDTIDIITGSGVAKVVRVFSKRIHLLGKKADLITVIDMTESIAADKLAKYQQEQIVQADKMASLGILSAGIAHEINNPNQYIMSVAPRLRAIWESILVITDEYYEQNGDFLLGGMSYEKYRDKISEYSLIIFESSKKINSIVNNMKSFSRLEDSKNVKEIDLNEVVHSAFSLLSNMIQKHTDVFSLCLNHNLPNIIGNFQRLEQVIINIIQNACQALYDKSAKISLETFYDRKMEKVILKISDEGRGIPLEDISRVRDPFFTTKRDSGGTGLGLSVISKIIEEHRGNMVIDSEVNTGTTVTIDFPIKKNNMHNTE